MQGVGELLGQPQQRRRLAASTTAQPGRVNGTQFDLSSIDAGLGANAAAACTPSAACNASWALPAAAVVDIYAINARGGAPVSMGLCTGARPGALLSQNKQWAVLHHPTCWANPLLSFEEQRHVIIQRCAHQNCQPRSSCSPVTM